MQSVSIGIVGAVAFIAALIMALAIFASPLIAALLFVIAFGGFLVWRGYSRSQAESRDGRRAVPSTEQASADAADTGPAVVAGRRRG
jgi:hypothetical protein